MPRGSRRSSGSSSACASASIAAWWSRVRFARVGRTEVVLIAGEPGIGKSRLLTEFIGLATSAEDGVRSDAPRVLRWTFSRVNQRSYAGFIEPLLVELRIDPNDPEASAKLPDKLRELNFANPELVAPTLAQFS